jgi:preprotein translocase subunit SecE
MKDSEIKKVWTTTTKKSNLKRVSLVSNKVIWLLIIAIALLIIFSSMYFPIFIESPSLMAIFIISGVVVLLILGKQTNEGIKCWDFLLESKLEIRKIVWPSKQETINSTLIVIAIVFVVSMIIYFIGMLFMYFIQFVLS